MVGFALAKASIRPGALDLVDFCRAKNGPLELVSGGLDLYITPLLREFGMDDIPVRSWVADFDRGDLVVPTCPPEVEVCERVGVCKCSRVWHYQKKGYTVLFAGDGASDQCVVGEADRAYARSSLAAYCDRTGIEYTPFETFDNILDGLRLAIAARVDDEGGL